MRKLRAVPARPSCALDPISAMSWGVEPVRRDQQGKSIIRMGGVYAIAREIASDNEFARSAADLAIARIRRRRCGQRVTIPGYLARKFAQILFLLRGLTLLE